MGQLIGTAFGTGTPTIYPTTQNLGGFSPFAGQAAGLQAFPQQPYAQSLSNPFGGGYGAAPYGIGMPGSSPLQQIAQLLQIVPQQLHQVQLLQQQQVLQLQQLLQWVPAQLQQLQQLVQLSPLQAQQQQGQPFGAGIYGPATFGLAPQAFAGQAASHVM
jgi:hypothetical protein